MLHTPSNVFCIVVCFCSQEMDGDAWDDLDEPVSAPATPLDKITEGVRVSLFLCLTEPADCFFSSCPEATCRWVHRTLHNITA